MNRSFRRDVRSNWNERERRGKLDIKRETSHPRQFPPRNGHKGPDAEIGASAPIEEALGLHDLSAGDRGLSHQHIYRQANTNLTLIRKRALKLHQVQMKTQTLEGLRAREPRLPFIDDLSVVGENAKNSLEVLHAKRGGGSDNKQVVEISEHKDA